MDALEHRQTGKAMYYTGWVLSAIFSLMILMGAISALRAAPQMAQSMAKFGYSMSILPILATIEIVITALYLIPRTAVLGALLLTAYLGGAVATHARIGDPMWVVPVIAGVVMWVALFLRRPWLLGFLRQH